MNKTNWKNNILLLFAAIIFGGAFVAQSQGMDYLQPLSFNAFRTIIGCVVLVPVIIIFDLIQHKKISFWGTEDKSKRKTLAITALICGTLLAIATNTQQIGIKYTSVGKAGFITALYIVLVPIFGLLFKRKCSPLIWVSVVIALVGMYFLCINEEFRIEKGDLLVLVCAVVFSFHILMIDKNASKVDPIRLSCGQFFVCGVISTILMLIFEKPTFINVQGAILPLLYAGVMSCGIAYTFQIIGQKNNNPTIASLIMSLESVFSALFGWLILNQTLSTRETLGCSLVFLAVILAQIPIRKKSAEQNQLETKV